MVVVNKLQMKTLVTDVAIPSDSNIRTEEHEKFEKYQKLREEEVKMWKVKGTGLPVVTGVLGAVLTSASK